VDILRELVLFRLIAKDHTVMARVSRASIAVQSTCLPVQSNRDHTFATAICRRTVRTFLAGDRAQSFHQCPALLAIVDHEGVVFAMR
jgi:riboflavin synthase alpha subunit